MRKLLILTTLVLAMTAPATAKPISTKFEDAVKKSAVIAVARFDGARPGQGGAVKNCVLEFTHVLRGDVKPGKQVVAWRNGYTPAVGPRVLEFLAFLDETLTWHYVAVPVTDGAEVAGNVLRLEGFYDYNAHFVYPSLLSVPLLEKYLETGTMTYAFRGPLWFPVPGKAEWQASRIVLEGTHDPFKNQATIRGLPELKGLLEPRVSVNSWTLRDGIEIAYSRTRPLDIHGQAMSLEGKTATFAFRFYVTRPDFVSQKEFEAYAADSGRGDSHFRVKVDCPPADKEKALTLSLRLGERGRVGSVAGWRGREVSLNSSRSDGAMTEYQGDLDGAHELVVRFDLRTAPRNEGAVTWTFQHQLLYDLNATDLEGVVEVREKKTQAVVESRPCKASLEGVFYDPVRKK